jgi:hypothetical protein
MLSMKWTLSAVMLAAAFSASAQTPQNYRGSFKLPFEARFGSVVLQPGSYTVSTFEGASGIRISGDNGKVAILAAGYDVKPETEKSRMIFHDSGGMYTLQTFESGSMGKSLHFYAGKTPRGVIERAAVKPNVEIGLQ